MATSKVSVTEGSGKNAATYSFTEDAITKDIQRVSLNNSAGVAVDAATETTLALVKTAVDNAAVVTSAAGTSSADVVTVQGDVGGVPIPVSGAAIGSITETAPTTDTASSGLNGRLQRIAQRITSLIGLLPTALGANGGLKIEGVASGTVVPVSAASNIQAVNFTAATTQSITTGGTAQALFGAAAVNGFEIQNIDQTEDLWFSIQGTAAANTAGSIQLGPGEYYCSPPAMRPNSAGSVIAATTGHKFTAVRW